MRTIEEIKKERDRIWKENDIWNDGLDMIVSELLNDHIQNDPKKAIEFLDSLNEQEMDQFSQFFEDFIQAIHSRSLLDRIASYREKYPNIELEQDIHEAERTYIYALIQKYEQPGDFNHAKVSSEKLKTAEKVLDLKIPKQFRSFLEDYGHGGIGGIEILGVGLTGRLVFLDTTLEYRSMGLPSSYVAIENEDEWLYCIDCDTQKVVSWDVSGNIKTEFECFYEFFIDQLDNAIENL